MNQDPNTALYAALARFGIEADHVLKDALNKQHRNRYVSAIQVLNTLKPLAARHGLNIMTPPENTTITAVEHTENGAPDIIGCQACRVMVAHVDGGFVDFGRAELPFNYGNKGLTGADKALIVLTMLQRKVWLGLAGVAEAESEEQQLAQADKAQNELEAVLNAINDAESLDALRAIVNRHGKGPNAAAIIAAASARKLAIKPAKTTNGDDQ